MLSKKCKDFDFVLIKHENFFPHIRIRYWGMDSSFIFCKTVATLQSKMSIRCQNPPSFFILHVSSFIPSSSICHPLSSSPIILHLFCDFSAFQLVILRFRIYCQKLSFPYQFSSSFFAGLSRIFSDCQFINFMVTKNQAYEKIGKPTPTEVSKLMLGRCKEARKIYDNGRNKLLVDCTSVLSTKTSRSKDIIHSSCLSFFYPITFQII